MFKKQLDEGLAATMPDFFCAALPRKTWSADVLAKTGSITPHTNSR